MVIYLIPHIVSHQLWFHVIVIRHTASVVSPVPLFWTTNLLVAKYPVTHLKTTVSSKLCSVAKPCTRFEKTSEANTFEFADHESADSFHFFVFNLQLRCCITGIYYLLNENAIFDFNFQQQCTTNNVRLSKLRTSMLKLMELTDKYICKSSRSDSATTARTDVTDQAGYKTRKNVSFSNIKWLVFLAPITDDLCRKDFEPKSGNKKLVLCSIAAQQ